MALGALLTISTPSPLSPHAQFHPATNTNSNTRATPSVTSGMDLVGVARECRKYQHIDSHRQKLELGDLDSAGEVIVPHEHRLFIIYIWTERRGYCIQLAKEVGL